MFRANYNHTQQTFSDSTIWMNEKIREKLEKSWAPIFYNHVFSKIDEAPFAVLYGTTGKPNFPVNILLSLEYIKHMKCCTDLELLDYFYFDYLVNYAVGIRTLGEINLAERTLYYFRERIYQYCLENPGKDELLFKQFINLLHNFAKEAGISLEEQRTDTTLFMSNIKKAGRMSLAYDVLVKAVKAIPKEKLTDSLSKVLEPNFKTDVLYRTKAQEGDSKLEQVLNLCQEALVILETQPDKLKSDEVRIVKRFLSEQSIIESETRKLIPKPKKEVLPSSLQSAYDEDATFRKKGNVSQSGYVLEISETCDKDNTFQVITDYAVEPNNTSDVEILQGRLKGIRETTGCTDMYVDGGFHSEDVHQTAKENGIEIHLTNMSGTEPKKKIPVSAFDIDETTNKINKCPAGHIPTHTKVSKGQTTGHFSHEACANCELREQCYSKEQAKDCVVRISLKSVNTSRERKKMKDNKKENTSKRAGIEGSNSALKRSGLKKLDVRGKVKCTVVCGLKVTVQNIKRFIKYMQGGYDPKYPKKLSSGISAPIFS
jgi:hypothetical protein